MMRLVLALVLLAAVLAWAGDLYKWQDENGITRYSDRMPPTEAKGLIKGLTKLKSTASTSADENTGVPLPAESRVALKKHPITLYSFEDCGEICKKAEAFLDKRGVPYLLKNTDNDKLELQKLTGKLEVPALIFGNTAPIIGFEEGRWNTELDLAGYAKRNPRLKPGASTAIKPPPKEPAPDAETPAAEAPPENNAQ